MPGAVYVKRKALVVSRLHSLVPAYFDVTVLAKVFLDSRFRFERTVMILLC